MPQLPILVVTGVIVPGDAIEMHAARSGGPGGQNVNKVASKVELRVDLQRVAGLSADQRQRLVILCGGRLDAEGKLLVQSQLHRDQPRNLDDAREKVRALIERCLKAPRPRRATRPSRGSVERRLESKQLTARRKRDRKRID